MNRTIILCAGAALAFGGIIWALQTRSSASNGEIAKLSTTVEQQKQLLAERDSEVDELRDELEAMRRAKEAGARLQAAPTRPPPCTELDKTREAKEPRAGVDNDPTAPDEHALTAVWASKLSKELSLTEKQRKSIDKLADWAETQRDELAERAEKEGLDSAAVREEIALQREDYDKRMKALLTPSQFEQFDAIQGIDRRPPTFARVPWIMGDRTVPR